MTITSSSSSAARCITKILSSPSKVANTFDWHKVSGSVLSLHITNDKIDLAVASHPTWYEPIQTLVSIPIETEVENNRKILSQRTIEELGAVVHDWNICSFVVGWPVQKEGRCGAPCGKVLHVLEEVLNKSTGDILGTKRPLCLWDVDHRKAPEDEWGRAAIYSFPSDKTEHVASREQYSSKDGLVAADIWSDFFKAHWPEQYQQQVSQQSSEEPFVAVDLTWLDHHENKKVEACF